ncbi:thioredoxin family protein [Paenibacillus mucilaginosus]|uniref:Thioredoxin domain-containing protein n=2 Tax=Paenibacillus mucilaginosus TaxID=61624 RepID=H6NA04_9BACL|nr:thioredoxin family protein [Paenibacillus mucilaginosus]AEI40204.1 Thioredoxin domain protein [Paenibacillus mucilaginosus KNP414]AFC28848.1 Thioredoxin domain-containing protein [Paenibacillus mucilaginosus 3016]MCG7215803.1 thioredoxin family protein [Paenibacillus mucilaginosus]WDM29429.1 thioredoxin family protein [Paenibacillus mucilaginosus]WFA17608.1 thioredoxin [Paenibacillus mucilaginosus]
MKKLGIFLAVILVLFGGLYFVNQQSNQAKYGKHMDNVYGVTPDKLHPETLKLLDDPNYQSIILPAALDKKLAAKEDFFVYYFASTCPHCKVTTPVLMPVAKELGVQMNQFNLEEFKDGWKKYNLEYTPTLVYYKGGQEADRIVGEQKAPELKAFIEKHNKK